MRKQLDVTLTILLSVVLLRLLCVAVAFVFLNSMDVSCLENCDYGLTVFVVWGMFWSAVVIVVAVILGIGTCRVYRRKSAWVPAAAIVLTIALFFSAIALQTVGA
ncbi:hypothetical protein GCM10027413_24300 [Conyzicola nivalis]|uniref:Uncharacterized protein n=1 Tax=Conyzicola nivalis TaxID=1477021 RepID=A0A916SAM2_9MICO|nr:hypothetical protein [Conyzicola nivalis]GGA91195.1 hypothetical protein GCM10010979_02320 [Conyzicola nivalis]